MIGDLWYKNAIIYSVDVETFMDGSGDGIGDFRGLRSRLEYLASLGVTCLWLLPFYASPNRDNGYDVSDYYAVDPRLGDLGDFVAFSKEAQMHGLRIMVDLVVNHTSDQHPWFQRARSDPKSRYRDYYVWSSEKPADAHSGMVFPGHQKSTWTYDEVAGAYYFHRFYSFQPDLNVHNPAVREEILKIMGFWLELGVSGFRVDAVPFLIERQQIHRPGEPAHDLLTDMRNFISWRRGDAVMLAEANVDMDELRHYFDGGKRMQLAFNFSANQALFLSLARGEARALKDALRSTLHLETQAQWANFLRNHDELDLARLRDEERELVFARFGPSPDMQIFGRGLRRRLAPMLDGDRARLALAYSVMLTLPGAPVLWYGEEIGMGELLSLEGRQSVRTPMQWSDAPNGGFSSASTLVRPVVEDGPYGYRQVNVQHQQHDTSSLLSVLERLIRARRTCAEIGWGTWEVLSGTEPHVLATRYRWQARELTVVHNFAARGCQVVVDASESSAAAWVEVLGGTRHARGPDGQLSLQLQPYGFAWLRTTPHGVLMSDTSDGVT